MGHWLLLEITRVRGYALEYTRMPLIFSIWDSDLPRISLVGARIWLHLSEVTSWKGKKFFFVGWDRHQKEKTASNVFQGRMFLLFLAFLVIVFPSSLCLCFIFESYQTFSFGLWVRSSDGSIYDPGFAVGIFIQLILPRSRNDFGSKTTQLIGHCV